MVPPMIPLPPLASSMKKPGSTIAIASTHQEPGVPTRVKATAQRRISIEVNCRSVERFRGSCTILILTESVRSGNAPPFRARYNAAIAALPSYRFRPSRPSIAAMNPADHRTGASNEIPGDPVLLDWQPGADVASMAPDEMRVWIVDLDAGLAPGEDIETRPSRGRSWRSSPTRNGRGPRGSSGLATEARFARCRAALREILGRLLDEPAGSLRFRTAAVGKPELDREPDEHPLPCGSTSPIPRSWA